MHPPFLGVFCFFCLTAFLLAEPGDPAPEPTPSPVPLWDGPAPQGHGSTPDDIPSLTVFLPESKSGPTAAVVICPGGGYGRLSLNHEGINIARWFQSHGVAGLVLQYRLPKNGYLHPVPLLDAQRAQRLARSHAQDWNIDPKKVGVIGFSAGGHLASTVATHFDSGNPQAPDAVDRLSCRPDFAVLVYPVISMKDDITHRGSKKSLLGTNPDPALVENLSNDTQVTSQTPPTLLVHAQDDRAVPIENSRLMYAALQKAGVVSAIHEYPIGGHGFGFGDMKRPGDNPRALKLGWIDKAGDWLKAQGFLPGP